LHVSGNQLVDDNNQPVRLIGVNRSGSEYACVQGFGLFDGPVDDTSIQAITTWHVNAVRVPLNEDCWLGINGVNAQYAGNNYISAIQDFVNRLHAHGLYAILDLHWTAPSTYSAGAQNPMPDADHTPTFWMGVAQAFANDNQVVFDLFNEPFPDFENLNGTDPWDCWLNGCTLPTVYLANSQSANVSWQAAGMQSLVNAVRTAGGHQPLMLGGLAYSNDLSAWLAHMPTDPDNALVASTHQYNFNTCHDTTCWNNTLAPVAAQVPLVIGEIGEDDCGHGFIDGLMTWADPEGASYLAWVWDAWGGCGNVLIQDYTGTPTTYGQGYHDHVLSIRP
jgi:hypothetical protein